jgi:hypothetical protein
VFLKIGRVSDGTFKEAGIAERVVEAALQGFEREVFGGWHVEKISNAKNQKLKQTTNF